MVTFALQDGCKCDRKEHECNLQSTTIRGAIIIIISNAASQEAPCEQSIISFIIITTTPASTAAQPSKPRPCTQRRWKCTHESVSVIIIIAATCETTIIIIVNGDPRIHFAEANDV